MRTAVTLALPVALAACQSGNTWTEAFDASGLGDLSSVWGSGPDDVFVVGGTPATADNQSTIQHFDGSDWSAMDAPDDGTVVWTYGFGPDDVYAVGIGGLVLHYDGSTWEKLDPGTLEDLWGVFGFSRDDLWIVGGDTDGDSPTILRYDGDTFTSYELAEEDNPRGANALFKVWGIDGELFAVGAGGLIVRWDGSAWKRTSAGAEAEQDFVSLWGDSADNIVTVGGRTRAQVAVWDGTAWTTQVEPTLPGLNAVFMETDGTTRIGGQRGFLAEYDVATGEITPDDAGDVTLDIHALWGDGTGRAYAVGGRFFDPHEGVALVLE